jgi:hypothetical protein
MAVKDFKETFITTKGGIHWNMQYYVKIMLQFLK